MKMKGKGGQLPKEHSEKAQGKLGHNSNLRYADSEMGNPGELDKRNEGLASYAKKHKSNNDKPYK